MAAAPAISDVLVDPSSNSEDGLFYRVKGLQLPCFTLFSFQGHFCELNALCPKREFEHGSPIPFSMSLTSRPLFSPIVYKQIFTVTELLSKPF